MTIESADTTTAAHWGITFVSSQFKPENQNVLQDERLE